MAFKKNQLTNIFAIMVDKDDFATVESGMSANDINIKLYGVEQGVSTLGSTITVSKAARLIRSGIFQITLKATEVDTHDDYMLRLSSTSTVSCATQNIPLHFEDYSLSDVYSLISDVDSQLLVTASLVSDIDSQLLVNTSTLSDVYSLVSEVDSQLVVTHSLVSDIDSQLTVTHSLLSDVESQVDLLTTSNYSSQIHSDLRSQISTVGGAVTVSNISDIASRVWSEKWDIHSTASSFGSLMELMSSRISDIYSLVSDVDSQVLLNASVISDIDSQLTVTHSLLSDVESQVDLIPLSVTTSQISDIASRVWGEKWDVHSVASSFGSAFELLMSRVSDIDSQLTVTHDLVSDIDSQVLLNASMISDIDSQLLVTHSLLSDVESQVDANPSQTASMTWQESYSDYTTASTFGSKLGTLTGGGVLTVSDISDIASRVWSEKWTDHSVASSFGSAFEVILSQISDVDSQLLLNASMISDVDSQLTVTHSLLSDVESQVDLLATSDYLSNVHSDLRSAISTVGGGVTVSNISDIASRVWSEKWRVHSTASSFGSAFSDLWTNATQAASRALVTQSIASDTQSQLDVTHSLVSDIDSQVLLNASMISDVQSQLDVTHDLVSDIDSQLTVTHSLVSDIDSQVLLNASLASDAHSAAAQANSRTLVVQSMVSDVDSQLTVTHSLVSDIDSQLTVTHSLVSDIDSQVILNASLISDVDSQLTLHTSTLSDIQSAIAAIASDLPANYTKGVAVTGFMFPMFDSSNDLATGLSTFTAEISKDGGAFASITPGTVAEVSDGWYKINLSATEMNADEIALRFAATGARETVMKIRTNPT
jgi:hypothetical protein